MVYLPEIRFLTQKFDFQLCSGYGSGDWDGPGFDPTACKNINYTEIDYYYYENYEYGGTQKDSRLFAEIAENGKSGFIKSEPFANNVQCQATIQTNCEKVAFRIGCPKFLFELLYNYFFPTTSFISF